MKSILVLLFHVCIANATSRPFVSNQIRKAIFWSDTFSSVRIYMSINPYNRMYRFESTLNHYIKDKKDYKTSFDRDTGEFGFDISFKSKTFISELENLLARKPIKYSHIQSIQDSSGRMFIQCYDKKVLTHTIALFHPGYFYYDGKGYEYDSDLVRFVIGWLPKQSWRYYVPTQYKETFGIKPRK